jgi:2-polyprenyl-3-methyl-5-hydroxy-6-metoxy-1,4-benzoquinol methylase
MTAPRRSNIEAFYDDLSRDGEWAPAQLRPNATSTNAYDDVSRLLGSIPEVGKALEIGCGIGKFSVAIASQLDELIGIDISSVAIERAREKQSEQLPHLDQKVSYLAVNVDDPFPFEKEEFDVVFIVAVLEHVLDVFHVMDEVKRVCKSGGSVFITVPNAAYLRHVRDLLLGRVPLTGTYTREIHEWRTLGWDGAHFHQFTKAALSDLLKDTGFTPQEWTGDGKWAKYRRWHSNLSGSLTVRATRD